MIHHRGVLETCEEYFRDWSLHVTNTQWDVMVDALRRGCVVGFHAQSSVGAVELLGYLSKHFPGLPWDARHDHREDCTYIFLDDDHLTALSEGAGE
jgi:hypothetical protein